MTTVMDAGGPRGGHNSQTDTAWQTLQTEIQALAAKSDVTIADLSALASDSQAIATAGGDLKADGLKTVLGSLAVAVAVGGDSTQAQADFNALFSGSNVGQATIDKTFTDLVQAIKDSNITADASLIAADPAAVQADLAAPPQGGMAGNHGDGRFGGPGGMFGGTGDQGGGAAVSNHPVGHSGNPGSTAGNMGGSTAVPADSSNSGPPRPSAPIPARRPTMRPRSLAPSPADGIEAAPGDSSPGP